MKAAPISNATERRVVRACRHVSDLWFPADPELVAKFRKTLGQPDSGTTLNECVLALEGDFSLFMFALKEMLRMLKDESIPVTEFSTPADILRQGGLERLREIFSDGDPTLSRHLFDTMDSRQVARMREAVISASATRALAGAQELSPELGFFASLLRQLGLTLIAWNYPGVYERASEQVKTGKTYDDAITEILGFSPGMLAMALARDWDLPREFSSLLIDEYDSDSLDALDREIEADAVARSIRELCRIGEALARANEPETYPSARTDWEMAKEAISTRLGPQGLEAIQNSVHEQLERYEVSIPSFFRGGLVLDPEVFIERYERQESAERNPYLSRCRLHVQERLCGLYLEMKEGRSAQALLRKLSQEIVPACGFSAGCVFTIDPTREVLIPQLRIGTMLTRTAEPVPCDISENSDFVAIAYRSEQPLAKAHVQVGESDCAVLASVFGHSQRVGVLLLEMPSLSFKDSEAEHLVHLRALALTLTDLLSLG